MTKEKPQIEKFKAAAKEAECDLDEARFDDALGKLAKVDPLPVAKPKTKPKKPAK